MPPPGDLTLFVVSLLIEGGLGLFLVLFCFVLYFRSRQALRRLAESEDRFRILFEHGGVGLALLSAEGAIVQANPALEQMLGYEPGQLCGRRLSDLSHPDDRGDETRRMRQQAPDAAADQSEREKRYLHRNGGVVWARVVRAVVRDGAGNVRYHASVLMDVTERRRLEEQVRQSQKLETLATLVGGISHDFNNQLTAVIGNLSLVLEDLRPAGDAAPEEDARRNLWACVESAEQAAQRCAAMTARLLTFSRGRIGARRPLRLNQLLPEAARLLRPELPASVRLEVRAPDNAWPIEGDWAQLHQMVHALAVNAGEAMPDGGVLELALTNHVVGPEEAAGDLEARPGRFVELRVRDEGRGMTPEVCARLFEPFFTTKPAGHGVGLGLSEVYGVIKGHQGWIKVESEPDRGSTFRVYLPAAASPVPAEPVAPAAEGGGGECVLVVDDEDMVRDLARLVLERRGYRVLTACDGEEALTQYGAHPGRIDLVLLDYTMPGLTGLQVFEALRKMDPKVCVVFSSGYGLQGDATPLLTAGARAFVPKPYRPDELVQAIRKVLDEKAEKNTPV